MHELPADRHEAPAESPISVSHFVHTLKAYRPAILLSLAAVMIGYGLLSILYYLVAPAQRVTVVPFRLNFEGAASGNYPNGLRFTASDIVMTPVLLNVYNQNGLQRYMPFPHFVRSIYVLESNRSLERLMRDYEARLADPKVSPLERDRLTKEFESKRDALAKNEYSIQYVNSPQTSTLPRGITEKVLNDTLEEWSRYAAVEQRVLHYRVPVLSPEIFNQSDLERGDFIIAVQVLRSRIYRVLQNIIDLRKLPGAELARTRADRLSLVDVETRLEDIIRFRLEPLMPALRASGMVRNPAATLSFLQAQLSHDQRILQARREHVASLRQALAAYTSPNAASMPLGTAEPMPSAPSEPGASPTRGPEAVMPQLNDTFLDRLMMMTRQTADIDYRQRLVDELKRASAAQIPAELAVTYDMEVIEQMRNPGPLAGTVTPEEARRQIDTSYSDARALLGRVNELYLTMSKNLNLSGELMTRTGAPITRKESTVSLPRLLLWGMVVFLAAIPVIIAACLLHNRVREEEEAEGAIADPAHA